MASGVSTPMCVKPHISRDKYVLLSCAEEDLPKGQMVDDMGHVGHEGVQVVLRGAGLDVEVSWDSDKIWTSG